MDEDFKLVAPVPRSLSKVTMTDPQERLLMKCPDNLQAVSFPSSKIELGLLDWTKVSQKDFNNQFNFIIGCDYVHYSLPVGELARNIAYSLKCSPQDNPKSNQEVKGNLLHIGPHCESIDNLEHELRSGYRMNTKMTDIVLERIELMYLLLNKLEDAEMQMEDEIEGDTDGNLEYQNVERSRYSAIVGHHNEEYSGYGGDIFFPAEVTVFDEKVCL